MNTIRAKISFSWLLFLLWGFLLYLHHYLIAWCVYGLVILVRSSKPKVPQLPQRIARLASLCLIVCLMVVLIDNYYPFPSGVVTIGMILGGVLFSFLFLFVLYLDYKAFK